VAKTIAFTKTKKKTVINLGHPQIHNKSDREIAFLFEKYLEKHPDEVVEVGSLDPQRVTDWAFDSGIYSPPKPPDPKTQLRRKIGRHFGRRYMTDPQGREVRALIAVPGEISTPDGPKTTFKYYPLFQTDPGRIESGLKLRLNWAFKRVEQVDTDWHSYNENNDYNAKLRQLDFDFRRRLDERAMPETYPDSPPDDVDEEDDD